MRSCEMHGMFLPRFIASPIKPVGESAVMKGVDMAKRWWHGAGDAGSFIASQPQRPVAAIARAAGNIIDTRRDRLFALAERFES